MKNLRSLSTILFLMVLLLTACGPTPTPAPDDGAPPPPTDTPTSEPPPPPATIEPVAMPPLTVGSMMLWYDGAQLVYVPEGSAIMGHTDPDNPTSPDGPQHTVEIGSFWMYRFPVTNSMYLRCVAAGQCAAPMTDPLQGYPDYTDPALKDEPVVGVNYAGASAYCSWMGGALPTEAQWEKAARGPEGRTYPWGEGDPACNLANAQNCFGELTRVFDFPDGQSYYHIFDLAGDAFEWVLDWYDPNYYGGSPAVDPVGPELGTVRSVRGSAYGSALMDLPSWRRFYLEPEKTQNDLGFRCVIIEPAETGYAPYCEISAYVPGTIIPGGVPPLGEPPEVFVQYHPADCVPPDIYLSVAAFCAIAPSVGGANVEPVVLDWGTGDVKGFIVSPPPECWWDAALNKHVCSGPTDSTVFFEVCRYCSTDPGIATFTYVPVCAPGYYLDPATGICTFDAIPPDPTIDGTCPPGWLLDPATLLCVQIVPGTECPDGYVYDPATECCVATFTDPTVAGGTPGATYGACPFGWSWDAALGTCVLYYPYGSNSQNLCAPYPVQLGGCGVTVTEPPPQTCQITLRDCLTQQFQCFDAVKCVCYNPSAGAGCNP